MKIFICSTCSFGGPSRRHKMVSELRPSHKIMFKRSSLHVRFETGFDMIHDDFSMIMFEREIQIKPGETILETLNCESRDIQMIPKKERQTTDKCSI